MAKTSVVIPNWNGERDLPACLDSLLAQSNTASIMVVDNGSTDNSVKLVHEQYQENIELVQLPKNHGFAGGVNAGIKRAIENGAEYVALLNNDALADKNWLEHLESFLDTNTKTGIATSKILDKDGEHLDSTGEGYTIWGLPYPRGRGEKDTDHYDKQRWIFGASGGASIYRVKMLQQIGLFDEDFFAYYEDVDLSFRAQLAGWTVGYVPQAMVYHQIGTTSSRVKDFTTYQTLKNLPMLMWKNVPWSLMPKVWPRFELAYSAIALSALRRGQFGAFFKGTLAWALLSPQKLIERSRIQKKRQVTDDYIWSIITHDLPPNANKLRGLRNRWWKLKGRKDEAGN